MGYTRQLGQLAYLITYDGSGNITVPASLTQGSVTSSMLKTDVGGKLVAAVAGTDYVAPSALSSYVPTTRTITINGTAYDLSADRSWSIVSGVSSFNTRTGAITLTSGDVTTALGYTPVTNARTITINGTTYDLSADRSWSIVSGVSSFNTRTGAITLTSLDVTSALGYTPVTNARTITINGTTYDLSADRSWSIVSGVSSFNTRTGAITLTSGDVTTALTYTPVTNARTITINGTAYDLSADRTWVVDTSSVTTRVIQKFTATSSQTTFTITGGYTVGMVDVFLNGIKLDNATEFTATDGSVVTLAAGAATGDIVEVYKYGGQFIANNTLRQSTLFTATAGQTTFTVNYSVGFVDVFYNGSKLDSSEFTATNGTSIVLGTACVLNDKVEVVAYNYTVGAFTGVGGSGTSNYVSKWTASGTLGNSIIYDNGTNVGIGTTTPYFPLQVAGNISSTNDGSNISKYFFSMNSSPSTSYTWIQGDGRSTGYISFTTNDTERTRIDSDGVTRFKLAPDRGIRMKGATSSYSEIAGYQVFTENIRELRLTGSTLQFYSGDGSNSTGAERMRVTEGGGLAIGMTSSPYCLFSVKANTTTPYGGANVYANGNGNFIAITHDNNTGWISTDYAAGGTGYTPLAFSTNALERFKITTSGAIEFKGQSTGANLKALWYNTDSETSFYSTEGGGTVKDFFIYSSGSATTGGRLKIASNGDISLSSYGPAKGLLFYFQGGDTLSTTNSGAGTTMYLNYNGNGVIRAGSGGNTTLYAGSDIRIKQNINVVDSVLDKVLQLIPKTYEYKDLKDDKLYYGFIAQEVEQIFPELVRTAVGESMCNDEVIIDQKSIESFSLVWASILTKAIQEQQVQIEELKALING